MKERERERERERKREKDTKRSERLFSSIVLICFFEWSLFGIG